MIPYEPCCHACHVDAKHKIDEKIVSGQINKNDLANDSGTARTAYDTTIATLSDVFN
jgi:hypothetical protein